MADLVKHRDKFLIKPQTVVEVRVTWIPMDELPKDENGGTGALVPWYQCVTCGDKMIWKDDQKLFDCPDCGYQLTADEATALCDMAMRSVQALASITRKKRGFLWRLSRLFGGKARRMLASSS